MPLKIELKPYEYMLVANVKILNDSGYWAHLSIEGQSPVLREKDVMHELQATTPLKQLYYSVQNLYLTNQEVYHDDSDTKLFDLCQEPSKIVQELNEIQIHLDNGRFYKALKEIKRLIDTEDKKTVEG